MREAILHQGVDAAAYWQERCRTAEDALQRARTAVVLSATRRAILRALADLKPGEAVGTDAVRARSGLQLTTHHIYQALSDLSRRGMVDRVGRAPREGAPGIPSTWRLAHLVQVPE